MVVISDTSIISNLLQIGHLNLLHVLFEEALIPPAVHKELNQMSGEVRFRLGDHPWLQVKPLSDYTLATQLQGQLDPGEAEAIALAQELSADVLLMDEAKGRKLARQYGIPITGLLGVLLAGKSQGHIASVTPLMDKLIHEANFRIGKALYAMIQEEAGE